MGAVETVLIYALIGLAVGVGAALQEAQRSPAQRLGIALSASVFWPVHLPVLLGRGTQTRASAAPSAVSGPLEQRILQSERGLREALARLDGVAEEVLSKEQNQILGVSERLRTMSARIAEMDSLLESSEFSASRAQSALDELEGQAPDDPRVRSVRARMRNIERLANMRARAYEELERALLKIEELGSQLALLKFAEDPQPEVARLLQEIAVSVDCVSEGLFSAESAA